MPRNLMAGMQARRRLRDDMHEDASLHNDATAVFAVPSLAVTWRMQFRLWQKSEGIYSSTFPHPQLHVSLYCFCILTQWV